MYGLDKNPRSPTDPPPSESEAALIVHLKDDSVYPMLRMREFWVVCRGILGEDKRTGKVPS